MKKIKITAAILSLALLTACNSGKIPQTSETVSETEASSVTTTSAATTKTETVPETEPAEAAEENEYVEVSSINKFIDFEFIENYQGTTDIGDLADKAVEFLKTTDDYAESMKNISEFSDGEFSDYIKDGVIVPKFSIAYPNDYDGDGRTENFIMVDIPYYLENLRPVIRNILIFEDSGGEMEVIGDYSYFHSDTGAALLNYGKYKQIIFDSSGACGADMHTVLYGVKDSKAVEHFGVRGRFEKENCFLRVYEYYSNSCFLYCFDTFKNEYREIVDVPASIDKMEFPQEPYAQVSAGNEFIDFNLIPNYPGTTDIGSLEDKALEFLKATDFYADSMKNADKFKWESFMRPAIGDAEFKERMRQQDEEEAAEFAVYLDENGNVQPKLSAAYPADYDGDGKEEAFIILDMPMMINNSQTIESYVIFSSSDGKMTMLDNYPTWVLRPARLIDYGKVKHIVIGGDGTAGAESVNTLYGVQNGECVSLYCNRVGYYKENCFLATYGWQGSGDFMYYDTVKQKYCNIYSASVSLEKIKEMDKDNVFEKYYKQYEEDGYIFFDLIGGKYYCVSYGPMDTGVIYTYENGKFIRQEHCYARASRYGTNVDIDKALAEMKPVSDPISPVSKGSEFIDFEFIESYQGTADIGDLADKAVNYIKDGYFCETANKYANEFSDEKFAAYFDSDGNIVPKLLTAYPNDYDGDGKTETFIIVEMPYYMERSEIAVVNDYLIFADSDGNVEMCNQFSGFDPEKDVTLLNYGKYKHILFHADGYESDKTTVLCGAHTWSSRAVTYYDRDGVLKKDGCYLYVSDSYASDYFMYFDTVTQEYITLLGKNYGSSMPAPLGTNQNAEIKPVQK